MSALVTSLVLGFGVGALWLAMVWLYFGKRLTQAKPLPLMVKSFLLGTGLAVVALVIEGSLPLSQFQQGVIGAPIVEECVKLLGFRLTIYRREDFQGPIDGFVYAAALGLGFASFGTAGFLWSWYTDSWDSVARLFVLRAVFAVPAQALFSSIWGYLLGVAKSADTSRRTWFAIVGLVLAIASHALYNFVIAAIQSGFWKETF